VVGRGVDIGAATVCGTLRFDDGAARQRAGGPGGRWETPPEHANAAYFGDYARTGVNVTLQPGRSVGAYSCVGPAVLVADDVPERTLVQVRQALAARPWGPERYGW
jgi:acetyltransferase-like isoleucine patch superfamily enzyme